jgi:hypothetical protein
VSRQKKLNIALALVIIAAVVLYVGHLISVSREKTKTYDALARQPVEAVQSISPEQLQFVMHGKLYDRKTNNQAVVFPGRERYQSADAAVQTADERLIQAMYAVAASLCIYDYDWWNERPAVAPGTGGMTLSFFDGDETAAKTQFLVMNGELRQIVPLEDGWLYCRYPVDAEALRELEAALRAVGN